MWRAPWCAPWCAQWCASWCVPWCAPWCTQSTSVAIPLKLFFNCVLCVMFGGFAELLNLRNVLVDSSTHTPTPHPFGERAKRPNTLFHLSPIHPRPLHPPTPLSPFPCVISTSFSISVFSPPSFLLDFPILLVDFVLFLPHLMLLLKAPCVTSTPPLLRALRVVDTCGI